MFFSSSDLNECLRESNYCHELASCTNERGSYSCKCNRGYIGDGFDCYYSYAGKIMISETACLLDRRS